MVDDEDGDPTVSIRGGGGASKCKKKTQQHRAQSGSIAAVNPGLGIHLSMIKGRPAEQHPFFSPGHLSTPATHFVQYFDWSRTPLLGAMLPPPPPATSSRPVPYQPYVAAATSTSAAQAVSRDWGLISSPGSCLTTVPQFRIPLGRRSKDLASGDATLAATPASPLHTQSRCRSRSCQRHGLGHSA